MTTENARHESGAVPAAIPDNERERLAALRSYDVLDTLPEDVYDDLVFLASVLCQTPIALISFVDEHRQFLKANVGLPVRESSRDVAFCAHAILGTEMFVVPDAAEDARFANNPLVVGDPKIRFYAGVPLRTPEGLPIGTICAIDRAPRTLTADQAQALAVLGRQVMAQLELRRMIVGLEETLAATPSLRGGSVMPPASKSDLDAAAQRARTLLAQGAAGGAMGERIRSLLTRFEELRAKQRGGPGRAPVSP